MLTENNNLNDLIKDGTESTFMSDVIEASKKVPIIVDFWAPWCGPCKTLGPALEAAVLAVKGKVKMVKIDIDQSQQIAAQLQVKSIPTVYAFFDGKPVDAFQGAQPESEIKKFIEKLLPLTNDSSDSGLDEAISAAEQMLEDKDFAGAAETFAAILGEDPVNSKSYAGLARAYLELGEIDKVEHLIENIPTELQSSADIESIKVTLNLLARSKGLAGVEELTSLVEKNSNDKQAKLDLALVLIKESRISDAIVHLLELFEIDRDWNEEAAKSNLLTVFDTMKPDDPLVLKARRRLSSLIFS